MSAWEQFMEFLSNTADELGLEDDEKESFVNSGMRRKGFKQVTSWADPEGDDGDTGSGDFFSQKRERKTGETRKVGKQSGSNWQYGS